MRFVCIASGPSLTQQQVDLVFLNKDRVKVMVVNDCYRLAPWADFMYSCDSRWWNEWGDDVKAKFKGQKWSASVIAQGKYGTKLIKGHSGSGLCKDGTINYGLNSGHQAINLAWYLGAREYCLIGYDMKIASDGKKHWFGDHPDKMNVRSPYGRFIEAMDVMAKDLNNESINVYNCSIDTDLKCFNRMSLEEYFEMIKDK